MKKCLVILICILVNLFACSIFKQEVARMKVPLITDYDNPKFRKVTLLNLNKGDKIYLWSDMDMEIDGKAEIKYLVKVTSDVAVESRYEIVLLDSNKRKVTLNEMKFVINNNVKWKYKSQYYEYNVPKSGDYTFAAGLVMSGKSVKIYKSELFLKK